MGLALAYDEVTEWVDIRVSFICLHSSKAFGTGSSVKDSRSSGVPFSILCFNDSPSALFLLFVHGTSFVAMMQAQ